VNNEIDKICDQVLNVFGIEVKPAPRPVSVVFEK
jgi:hypothetical protein